MICPVCEYEYKLSEMRNLNCCFERVCLNCYDDINSYYEFNGFSKNGVWCRMCHSYKCFLCGYTENKKPVKDVGEQLTFSFGDEDE